MEQRSYDVEALLCNNIVHFCYFKLFLKQCPFLYSVTLTIVNPGTGYETLGISKAGTIQSQLDVEPTVTLYNLLFLVRKLISNKLVEAFDWLSCRKKGVFVAFCTGLRPKK